MTAEATKHRKQNDRAGCRRRHGGEVKPFNIGEAEQRGEKEVADQSSDDAYDQVRQQTVVTACYPLGNPASDKSNHNAGENVHDGLNALLTLKFPSAQCHPCGRMIAGPSLLRVSRSTLADLRRRATAGLGRR